MSATAPRESLSAVTLSSHDGVVRIVKVPEHDCIDIRVDGVRITVFSKVDGKMPDVRVMTEAEARQYELARYLKLPEKL